MLLNMEFKIRKKMLTETNEKYFTFATQEDFSCPCRPQKENSLRLRTKKIYGH